MVQLHDGSRFCHLSWYSSKCSVGSFYILQYNFKESKLGFQQLLQELYHILLLFRYIIDSGICCLE